MKLGDIEENFAIVAIDLARQARVAGNHPFGALLVLDTAELFTTEDTEDQTSLKKANPSVPSVVER